MKRDMLLLDIKLKYFGLIIIKITIKTDMKVDSK